MPAVKIAPSETSEVLACVAILNRSLPSFFGTKNPKRIEYLIERLLKDDLQVVRDLLILGPADFAQTYPVNEGGLQYFVEKFAEVGLAFTAETSTILRALRWDPV